ncbi:hypothetical protein KEM52_002611 [Ascosphaera acerosa]|nr:hypothetical protein KEM52_002611 [Ascosphaera acerosa]
MDTPPPSYSIGEPPPPPPPPPIPTAAPHAVPVTVTETATTSTPSGTANASANDHGPNDDEDPASILAELLFTLPRVHAYAIRDGAERPLTTQPRDLDLLLIPTTSPGESYLHLHIDPDIDIPCTTETTILFQAPNSYLIPQWDVRTGGYEGEFTRLEVVGLAQHGSSAASGGTGRVEELAMFETILEEMTAFTDGPPQLPQRPVAQPGVEQEKPGIPATARSENSPPPPPLPPRPVSQQQQHQQQSYANHRDQVLLVDDQDGTVLGELGGEYRVRKAGTRSGADEPVIVELPSYDDHGADAKVDPTTTNRAAADEYFADHPLAGAPTANAPSFARPDNQALDTSSGSGSGSGVPSSKILKTSHYISTFLVQGSEVVGKGIEGSARFVSDRLVRPAAQPATFSPTTHRNVQRAHAVSGKVVHYQGKTMAVISKYAMQAGQRMVGLRGDVVPSTDGVARSAKTGEHVKQGKRFNTLAAIGQISESVDRSTARLLQAGVDAATGVVARRHGQEAGEMARTIGSTARNAVMVYVDAAGVSKRAVVKRAAKGTAKGMVLGTLKRGKQWKSGKAEERPEN